MHPPICQIKFPTNFPGYTVFACMATRQVFHPPPSEKLQVFWRPWNKTFSEDLWITILFLYRYVTNQSKSTIGWILVAHQQLSVKVCASKWLLYCYSPTAKNLASGFARPCTLQKCMVTAVSCFIEQVDSVIKAAQFNLSSKRYQTLVC